MCPAFVYFPREPLINSGRAAMRFETVSGKARIAANSWTIGKIRNAAGGRFGLIDAVHELIRGSLGRAVQTAL
jgi:hypothetical protein